MFVVIYLRVYTFVFLVGSLAVNKIELSFTCLTNENNKMYISPNSVLQDLSVQKGHILPPCYLASDTRQLSHTATGVCLPAICAGSQQQ